MRFLVVGLLLLALGQENDQAKKLFGSMEKKLADAKGVQISVEATLDSTKGKGKIKGTMLLTNENKARVEISGELLGKEFKMDMVCDGAKMIAKSSVFPKAAEPTDAPKDLAKTASEAVGRVGVLIGIFQGRPMQAGKKAPSLDELLPVSDFAMGKKEKIGDRQAQEVQYLIKPSKKDTIKVQVWLDAETNLPLKRILTGEEGNEKITVTETYQIQLNPQIDAKKFVLPK
jgi:outer membrane lipoprotein-sorting protein